ncbi:vacuolar fusion protein ccz1 [Bulinus truncatus]|nr:vacuolar fusion protein ccz1 [Bulinus truncatus]
MFKLFNGTFTTILGRANGEVVALKQRLEHFYNKYLLTLKLSEGDILDVFNGIHFCRWIKIHIFEWTRTRRYRIMYKYLTNSLFPTNLEQELHGGQNRPLSTSGHYGKFMTGPANLNDDRNMGKLPSICEYRREIDEECYLIVYTALSATICLLVNGKSSLSVPLCRKVDSMLGPQMTKLASDISEQYNKVAALNSSEPVFKYVYFNHMNLAQQTTVHIDLQKRSGVNIPPDILRLLGDINADLTKENERW